MPVALEVNYSFDRGWRYATINPAGAAPIPEKALALIVWVRGDGSGNSLNCRFRDKTGQVHQLHLAELSWNGWRPVRIALDGSVPDNHWGGANDGALHPPLVWEAMLLIDSTHRDKSHSGQILIGRPFYEIGAR